MKQVTVKALKVLLDQVPDDTIICCQSDSEGNETSVCLGVFVETVGKEHQIDNYKYVEGDNIIGVDLEQDKGKTLIIFQPSL